MAAHTDRDQDDAGQGGLSGPVDRIPDVDPGAIALLTLLHLLECPLAEEELRRRSGHHGRLDLQRIAEAGECCDCHTQIRRMRPTDIAQLSVPLIAEARDGQFLVVVPGDGGDGPVAFDPLDEAERRRLADSELDGFSGRVVLFRRAGGTESGGSEGFGMRWFLPGLLRHRGTVAQLLGASLFIQLFAMVTPLFTMVIIDKVLSTGGTSTLNVLILGLAAIAVFDLTVGLLRGALLSNITHRIDVDLVARLFRHLSRLPLAYFGSQRTGDTVARVRELETVRQFLTGPSLAALVDFVFAFVFLFVMALFSVKLTLIVVAAITLVLALYAVGAPLMKRRLERRCASSADNQSFLVEAVSGMETIKSLSLEPQMQRRWEERAVEQTRFARESEQLTGNLSQIAQGINKATVAATLWLGALAVIEGSLTAGQLIAFNMMVGRVMAPALRLAQLFQQLSQTRVSVQRLREIFGVRPEPVARSTGDRLPELCGRVRLEQVSFRYGPEAPEVLREVSFEVGPGEVVGIVGASGSGKTSMLRLLQRLYVPTSGRLLIDGVNIAEIDPTWLRRHVGAITQDCVLFDGSVRENIAAAQPNLGIGAIEEAARLAVADEFIRALPQAYDTPVGERGAQLSVGQRQRIALARALAAQPRLLLLDEPTSSLDAIAEQTIQRNLDEIVRDRTVFLVAHRLSTLRVCTRVLVLDDGLLVEDGKPEELLAGDTAFARLKRAQRTFSQERRGEVSDEALAS